MVFAFILVAGLTFSLVKIWTWAIPQLVLHQDFAPVRAEIVGTRVVETGRSGSTTYRPEILVEYVVHATTFRVWAYDYPAMSRASRGLVDRAAAEEALRRFTPGDHIDCRYRIDAPERAVAVWKSSLWNWFFLLLSMSLLVLGAVGFILSFRLEVSSRERRLAPLAKTAPSPWQSLSGPIRSSNWPTIPDIRIINESPGTHLVFRLPLGNQPIFPLVGITLISVAWVVVAGVILFHSFVVFPESLSDRIGEIAFRGLFLGMGILLTIWAIHQILLAFSLAPTLLEISDHPVYPGRRYRVLLQQSGVLRFHRLTVEIVCEEIARFHQGTDTVTSRKDVFRQELFTRDDFETTAEIPLSEEFFLKLPHGAMHSFRQENNEIVWKLVISSQIAGWPDITRECPVIVRPVLLNDLTMEGDGL